MVNLHRSSSKSLEITLVQFMTLKKLILSVCVCLFQCHYYKMHLSNNTTCVYFLKSYQKNDNSKYLSQEKSLFFNLGFFDSIMGNSNNNKTNFYR